MKRIAYSTAGLMILAMVAQPAFAATEKSAPKPKRQEMKAKAEAPAPTTISGKIVETMTSAGYTYACVEKGGKKTWVAVPEMKLTVGQQASFAPGQTMTNFTSKTLNRTFESIIFSEGPVSAKSTAQALPPGHADVSNMSGGSKAAAAATDKSAKVEKAAGANAYSVGEVFEKRKSLDKKTVSVRGKVVKVSSGIMGATWIHLQDGSGDAKKGTNDLVVTTHDESVKMGDVVTAKGVVAKDKDFGMGYKYDVLIENATLQQ